MSLSDSDRIAKVFAVLITIDKRCAKNRAKKSKTAARRSSSKKTSPYLTRPTQCGSCFYLTITLSLVPTFPLLVDLPIV